MPLKVGGVGMVLMLMLMLWLSPLLSVAAVLSQQTCDTSQYPLSTPTSAFEGYADGTITNKRSSLMWLRCSVGQEWSGDMCVGNPKLLTWLEAQTFAKELNSRGTLFYNDWRIPQIHELATIAERQCRNPRINLAVFPETPAAAYWSLTSRRSANPDTSAYVLSFGPEGVGYEAKEARHYVRLVRNGP